MMWVSCTTIKSVSTLTCNRVNKGKQRFLPFLCATKNRQAYPVNRQCQKSLKELIRLNNFSYERPAKAPMGFNRSAAPDVRSGYTSALPENPVVAMAYVPFQTDIKTYDELQALKAGTLFPVLDKPFVGRGMR